MCRGLGFRGLGFIGSRGELGDIDPFGKVPLKRGISRG